MRWRDGQGSDQVGGAPRGRVTILLGFGGVALDRAPAVAAHAGLPVAPHDLAGAWNLSPPLLGSLFIVAWLYARGVTAGRRAGGDRIVPGWRAWAFAAGLVALALALVSPLDALAGTLFSAHMVQHVVLTLVAAPLLLLGAPALALLWALPAGWRRRAGRAAHHPAARTVRRLAASAVVVSLLYAVALWAWHLPRLYETALASEPVHALEHVTLLGAALLFWGCFIPAPGRRLSHGAGILVAFAAMLHGTVLSAMITFAGTAWYASYAAGAAATWGLTPLADQRLAGALMMLLSGPAYLAAAVIALTGWLSAAARRRARWPGPGALASPTIPLREADAP